MYVFRWSRRLRYTHILFIIVFVCVCAVLCFEWGAGVTCVRCVCCDGGCLRCWVVGVGGYVSWVVGFVWLFYVDNHLQSKSWLYLQVPSLSQYSHRVMFAQSSFTTHALHAFANLLSNPSINIIQTFLIHCSARWHRYHFCFIYSPHSSNSHILLTQSFQYCSQLINIIWQLLYTHTPTNQPSFSSSSHSFNGVL